MAVMSRLLPMMALSTFAVFLLALIATPVNALSNTEPHVHARGHDSVAKRKRNALKRAKRCRPKSTSLAGAASTTSATTSSTHAPAASSKPPTTKAPTSTSTTSKAVATTSVSVAPPSTGGGGSQKLLLAWPNGPDGIESWKGSNVKGIYSWSPSDPNSAAIGAQFFPMLWGQKQKAAFSKIDGSKYQYCMFLNEPNQVGQSDMSVGDAVALYWSTMHAAAQQGCKIVSPATTSAPSGLQWMKDFINQCQGCQIDAIALHWYDVNQQAFQDYVTSFYKAFGKDIWITEFACQNFNGGAQCSKDQTWAMHTSIAKFAQTTSWVKAISPFGAMRDMQGVNSYNQLMDPSTGKPNDLGQFWINGQW